MVSLDMPDKLPDTGRFYHFGEPELSQSDTGSLMGCSMRAGRQTKLQETTKGGSLISTKKRQSKIA